MMRIRVLLLVAVCSAAVMATEKKIVCYFGSWSVYREGNGKFSIDYIDPTLCTHLIYTFVGIQGNDVRVLDPWQDLPDNWGKNGFGRFNALRQRNPQLKTLVAIGGWNEGSVTYSEMARDGSAREQFANNVVKFVKKWGFDGFDVDWEYPAQRGGSSQDYDNYIKLLKALRTRFDREGLLLSAAVAAAENSASISYNIPEMSKYLDFINLMTYDFHGKWESVTGLNSPLYHGTSDPENNKKLTVNAAVEYWLSKGAPKEKLIVGVPFYGRTFTLANPSQNGIGAPTRGGGAAGVYTREPGMLGYNEICETIVQPGWTVVYNEDQRTPYAVKGDQWIGYDNEQSIHEKAEYISNSGLGGAMIWSIETDDFTGICGEKYTLLQAINKVLRIEAQVTNASSPPELSSTVDETGGTSEVPGSGETSEVPVITGVPGSEEMSGASGTAETPRSSAECQEPGDMADPNSCGFFRCIEKPGGGLNKFPFACPQNLCYDPRLSVCNWPSP